MKKAFLLLLWFAVPCASAFAEDAGSYRHRGDALRADGRFEEAVAEYKRALAENHLLPPDPGAVTLRDNRPLCTAIARHRAEIGMRQSPPEGR